MDWMDDNNPQFSFEARRGHFWENAVADFFRFHGIEVSQGKQGVRDHVWNRGQYANTLDMIANVKRVEVKSRGVVFYGEPGVFPHEFPNVDTVRGFDAKDPKPDFYVNISQETHAMNWLDVRATRAEWTVEGSRDTDRGINHNLFYRVHRHHLQPIHKLVHRLKMAREVPYLT